MMSRRLRDPLQVAKTVDELFGDDLHAMRVLSLANGVVGVLHAAVLSIHAIGRAYAHATGGNKKHGVKQTDRLLSNDGIDVWALFDNWVRFVVGDREDLVVALDWTDFDDDEQSTLAAYLITNHGRATPLVWRSFEKSAIATNRNEYEYSLIERLHACLAPTVSVTLLADRGFGDKKLYSFLQALGWDFVIRFRGIIQVKAEGIKKPASEWVPGGGRALMLRNVEVTQRKRSEVPAVVLVKAKNMREPWCLATSLSDCSASEVVKLYKRRFTIEETFRDQKNPRFGLGLSATHIGSPQRRDRLLFLSAIAQALLTLLGAAGEQCGLDRMLKVNTVKRRTQSLFSQGVDWYDALPNMKPERLELLMTSFDGAVRQHAIFREIFGVI